MLRHMAHYLLAYTLPSSEFYEAAAEILKFSIPCKHVIEMGWKVFPINVRFKLVSNYISPREHNM